MIVYSTKALEDRATHLELRPVCILFLLTTLFHGTHYLIMSDTFTGLIDPVDQNLFVPPNFEEAGGDTVTTSHHLRLWVKNLSHIRLPNTYYQQVVAVAVLLLVTFLVAAVALISAIALRDKASPSRATTRLQVRRDGCAAVVLLRY